jgi:hypothetical protein
MTPRSEFDRRLEAIRAKMEARNLDLLLIYSTPGSLRFGQRGHVMYVSGYEPYFGDTMLLLPRRASPEPLLEIDSADLRGSFLAPRDLGRERKARRRSHPDAAGVPRRTRSAETQNRRGRRVLHGSRPQFPCL